MSNAARIQVPVSPPTVEEPAPQAPRGPKNWIFLVTQDEELWPLVGTALDGDLTLKQVDSTDELLNTTPTGEAAVVLWDARDCADRTGALAQLQRHSTNFAIVVLDGAANTEAWRMPAQQRQIVSLVGIPLKGMQLSEALASARAELAGRREAPVENPVVPDEVAPARPQWKRYGMFGAAALVAACAVAYLVLRPSTPAGGPAVALVPKAPAAGTPAAATGEATSADAQTAANDQRIDALIDMARHAMADRHFIDPISGNALAYYQEVLVFDPTNGEAHEGMARIAQILVSRVQSDLDDQKYDLALQALETARTINPGDPALSDLDARIATLRSELGPAQIQAALNAKNFDRAAQLLDDAARAKSLSPAKLGQLRDELRQHRAESDSEHLLKLIDTRLQQDHLLEPPRDSAAFYLQQAREAGISAADLEQQTQEFSKRLLSAARTALDQHRYGDADRELAEARSENVAPAAQIASLQHDLAAAREQQAHEKSAQAQLLDLAKTRLAQGSLVEPDGDSALSYVTQLRSADPKDDSVTALASAVRTAIAGRARTALDSGDVVKAASLTAAAARLGGGPDLDALNDKIAQEQASQKPVIQKIPGISANTLVAVKPLRPEYPASALSRGTEGWVDLAFTVTSDGKVADVTVIDSSPKDTFDTAAMSAAYRVRYKPVVKDGHAITVTTQLRVVFRMSK